MNAAPLVLACLPVLTFLSAAPRAEELPAEIFAREFAFEDMRISPDGTRLAYSFAHNGSINLAVLDLPPNAPIDSTKCTGHAHMTDYCWKGKRLVIRTVRSDSQYTQRPLITVLKQEWSAAQHLHYNPQLDGRYVPERLLSLSG